MRAGAHEKEIANVFAGIMRAKPRALRQYRFEPEGCSSKGRESGFKLQWRGNARADYLTVEARQNRVFKRLGDLLSIGLCKRIPVLPPSRFGTGEST